MADTTPHAKLATPVSEHSPSAPRGKAREGQVVVEKKTSATGHTVKQDGYLIDRAITIQGRLYRRVRNIGERTEPVLGPLGKPKITERYAHLAPEHLK